MLYFLAVGIFALGLSACGAGELEVRLGDCAGCISIDTSDNPLTVSNETPLPDTTALPTVRFAASRATVHEQIGEALLLVALSKLTDHDVTVQVFTGGDDLDGLVDPLAVPPAVTIPAGEIIRSIAVPLIDNSAADGTRTLQLFLSAPQGATLADPARLTLTVRDNDGAAEPVHVLSANTAQAFANSTAALGGGGGCSLVNP